MRLLAVVVCLLSAGLLGSDVPLAGRVLAAEWPDEYRAGRFICHADFSIAPHRPLLGSLSKLERDLFNLLAIAPLSEPIHVFMFQKKSTYRAYLRQYFPEVPSRKALFIKGDGPGMVFAYRGDDFETDVRHECTHALLNAALPMVPLWLDEGLAEYFEVPEDRRRSGSPHLKLVKWGARLGQVPDIESLEQTGNLSQMTRTKYRHAWSWVHFMLHGPQEARDELTRYLAAIQALTPPGQLSSRLRRRLPNLKQEFVGHFKNWKSSTFLSL